MHQWTWSSLIQIVDCCLIGDKPFPEPMLAYCQLDSWEHISMKFESEFYHFNSRKCNRKCHLPKWQPFCPGGDELTAWWCLLYVWIHKLQEVSRLLTSVNLLISGMASGCPVGQHYDRAVSRLHLSHSRSPVKATLIVRFMGPTWGLPGADKTQVGLMWATWTLLSGYWFLSSNF